jgi:hypothetical protein
MDAYQGGVYQVLRASSRSGKAVMTGDFHRFGAE